MKSKIEKLTYAFKNIHMIITPTSFPTLEQDNEGWASVERQLGFQLHAQIAAGYMQMRGVYYFPSPQKEL